MQTSIATWMRMAVVAAALVGRSAPARADGPRVVDITARRFAFSPAEIHLRKGEPVTLRVHSGDVTHGFYLKALGIDAEIEPGKTTEVTITPREPGRFTVICDHFCGSGHGNMHLQLVVE
ncbi:MAG TPA: cupredoxin domain-containing protein [Anaeromyxobacteraceae bacterium]|nr:cupredoxin domain-containing protein [Anaeromyxobacteraceae bacterium]